jgi:hypothetical protein
MGFIRQVVILLAFFGSFWGLAEGIMFFAEARLSGLAGFILFFVWLFFFSLICYAAGIKVE